MWGGRSPPHIPAAKDGMSWRLHPFEKVDTHSTGQIDNSIDVNKQMEECRCETEIEQEPVGVISARLHASARGTYQCGLWRAQREHAINIWPAGGADLCLPQRYRQQ